MKAIVHSILARVLAWWPWFKPPPVVAPLLFEPPPIDLTPEPKPPVKRRRGKARTIREPLHITDILDLIPKCRELITRLRKLDEHAWTFWRVFGAKIQSDKSLVEWKVPPNPADLPGVGMVFAYTKDWKENDLFPGFFVYFTKLKKNPYNAAVPCGTVTTFCVTVAFIDHKEKGIAYEYFVALDANGKPTVVSQRNIEGMRLPRGGTIWQERWGYSAWLEYHFKESKRLTPKDRHSANIADFGERIFRNAMELYCSGRDDFQVRAERRGVSVAFNVALGRTPQFFKDRETGLAADGKRKRIFHSVEEHERVYPSGKIATVPAHYRGERSFIWKGEHITITPSDRSFAFTWKPEAELLPDGKKIPKGMFDIADHAEDLRKVTEADWRKNHPHGIDKKNLSFIKTVH